MAVMSDRGGQRNLKILMRFLLVLAGLISVYSIIFHFLMAREGQSHTWITGFYWTLTVMSTLGFGDITFHTDLGRGFSIIVLMSGLIFLLVLLPFTFIEFFYQPWMTAQAEASAPRKLPIETAGHVLIINYNSVTAALIRRFEQYNQRYALLVPEVEEALRFHDMGVKVMVGALDDAATYARARINDAMAVVSAGADTTNCTVAFTVRSVSSRVQIISTADNKDSVDILEMAGSNQVLRVENMIGQSFARRAIGEGGMAHLIGEFDNICIAEAMTRGTPLVGKTLKESNLGQEVGVAAVGVWESGRFEPAGAATKIYENSVLMLVGSRANFEAYNERFRVHERAPAPVVIIGGGRVGQATARALDARKLDFRVIEVDADRVGSEYREKYVFGNAADSEVLKMAGLVEASTVIITTHDDDTNLFLTIYCRKIHPELQIICRSISERNVGALNRAGADIVMSYDSVGANAIMNLLKDSLVVMAAEGLDLFKVAVPGGLEGKTILNSGIREQTGCSVVGVSGENGMEIMPNPTRALSKNTEILLIGDIDAEDRFLRMYRDNGGAKGNGG